MGGGVGVPRVGSLESRRFACGLLPKGSEGSKGQ